MSCEYYLTSDSRDGLLEAYSLFFHALANGFEDGESAVAFIKVKNARRDAESLQRAQSAYSEQQFLMDTDPAIAPVEPLS
jgi:hypothetical protein